MPDTEETAATLAMRAVETAVASQIARHNCLRSAMLIYDWVPGAGKGGVVAVAVDEQGRTSLSENPECILNLLAGVGITHANLTKAVAELGEKIASNVAQLNEARRRGLRQQATTESYPEDPGQSSAAEEAAGG